MPYTLVGMKHKFYIDNAVLKLIFIDIAGLELFIFRKQKYSKFSLKVS